MRCFLACDLPSHIRRTVSELITELGYRLPPHAIRWVNPIQSHLTLNFLGNDVPTVTVERLRETLPTVVAELPPLQLQLTTLGRLPPTGEPRVLYLGCGGRDEGRLRTLHRRLGELLVAAAVPIDQRPWHPHITLGRVRYRVPVTLADVPVEPQQFTVPAVVLYQSTLTPDGPEYVPLGKFPLVADPQR